MSYSAPPADRHLLGGHLIALQSSLGLYLMMNFMQRIPDEMLEAARIDGAKEIRIFWTVVMPNVKPAWLTLMIFSFQPCGTATAADSFTMIPQNPACRHGLHLGRRGGAHRRHGRIGLLLMIPPIILFISSQSRVIETMSTSGLK